MLVCFNVFIDLTEMVTDGYVFSVELIFVTAGKLMEGNIDICQGYDNSFMITKIQ